MQGTDEEITGLNLIVRDDAGHAVVQVCLLATFYFENAHQPEVREAALACLEDYCSLVGSRLRWMRQPGSAEIRTVPDDPVARLRNWLHTLGRDTSWEFLLHGGEDEDAASCFSVRALGSEDGQGDLSYFRITLPLTWFSEHTGCFPDMVLKYCQRLQPISGYGGLGIIESPNLSVRKQFEPAVYAMAQRFPGLEVDHPVAHTLYLKEGIKGVNWLTILGERWLQQLGKLHTLQKNLGEGFLLHSYSSGVQIQAGPRPQLGDMQQGRRPEPYMSLSTLLKPIRIKKHRAFHFSGQGRFDKQSSEAWLARFD